jgi:hypothetical protein
VPSKEESAAKNEAEYEKYKQLSEQAAEYLIQLELSRKEIDYLRRIIKLMEEKAELVQQVGKDTLMIH